MTRCKNDTLITKIGVNKLQKETEVDFTRFRYLPDCRKIFANKQVSGTGTYNRFKVPENQFECVRENCVNSGTLFNSGAATVYYAQEDAVEFANGVVTFYVTGAPKGTVTFKISETQSMTNADVYTIDLSKLRLGDDGFKAVAVDLSQTPTSTDGNGWTPNHVGAFISIAVAPGTGDTASEIGISSIAIYDTLDDFETSATVRIACLSTVGGTFDFEPVEATCFGNGGIDDEAIDTFEINVTGKALTPNYMLLNPLMVKGDATEGWDTNTVEKVVEAGTGDNAGYGVIILPDKASKECGFINVARADNCNVTDAHLVQLSVPNKARLDEGHFIVTDNDDGSATVYVNEALVGETLIIAYPQKVEVEEYVLDVDGVRYIKTRMSYTRTLTDGVKYRFVYDNVIITSFPDEISDEETEFEFTVTIQKDATGRFGRVYRILG